jgi:hypothetical protein
MDDKITIIEGPPPTFEPLREGWALGLNDSASLTGVVVTRLRTFNGAALVERCHQAWHNQSDMILEYRDMSGLEHQSLILAARTVKVDEGDILILWVRLTQEEVGLLVGSDDDLGDESDDDLDLPE